MPGNRELHDRYTSFSDEELLAIAAQRSELTTDAQDLIDHELKRRNLSLANLEQAEEAEPEPEVTSEPLPPPEPPQELPEDWFDDNEPLETASASSRRPAGITFVAYGFIGSISWLWFAFVIFDVNLYIAAFFSAATIIGFWIGIGLFRMRRWALTAAIVLYVLSGTLAGILIIVLGIFRLLGNGPNLGGIWLFGNLIFAGIILKYLFSPTVQRPEIWR